MSSCAVYYFSMSGIRGLHAHAEQEGLKYSRTGNCESIQKTLRKSSRQMEKCKRTRRQFFSRGQLCERHGYSQECSSSQKPHLFNMAQEFHSTRRSTSLWLSQVSQVELRVPELRRLPRHHHRTQRKKNSTPRPVEKKTKKQCRSTARGDLEHSRFQRE